MRRERRESPQFSPDSHRRAHAYSRRPPRQGSRDTPAWQGGIPLRRLATPRTADAIPRPPDRRNESRVSRGLATIGVSHPARVVASMLKCVRQCHMVVTILMKTRGASAPSARKRHPHVQGARPWTIRCVFFPRRMLRDALAAGVPGLGVVGETSCADEVRVPRRPGDVSAYAARQSVAARHRGQGPDRRTRYRRIRWLWHHLYRMMPGDSQARPRPLVSILPARAAKASSCREFFEIIAHGSFRSRPATPARDLIADWF